MIQIEIAVKIRNLVLYLAANKGEIKPELAAYAVQIHQIRDQFARYYGFYGYSWEYFAAVLKSYSDTDIRIILDPVLNQLPSTTTDFLLSEKLSAKVHDKDSKLSEIDGLFTLDRKYKDLAFNILQRHVKLTNEVVNEHKNKTDQFINLLWTVRQINSAERKLNYISKKTLVGLLLLDPDTTSNTIDFIRGNFIKSPPADPRLDEFCQLYLEDRTIQIPAECAQSFQELMEKTPKPIINYGNQVNEAKLDLSSPLYPVNGSEWFVANRELENRTNGTKSKGGSHSFVKVEDKIYCLAKKISQDPVIKQGSISKVKYAVDEAFNLYVMKIDEEEPLVIDDENERDVLQDLDIGFGSNKREGTNKRYTVLKYLGKSLNNIISEQSDRLNDNWRFDIAIQLTNHVYRLHNGLLSKTKTGYAHNDIKPDNVVIDAQGNVRLIDFGLTRKNPFEKGSIYTGASRYTAYNAEQKLTAAELDIIGLKRTLFVPRTFYGKKGYTEFEDEEYENEVDNLFPQYFLDQYNLNEFINTRSVEDEKPIYANQVMDLVVIGAALINAKEKLGLTNAELRSNLVLCHAIVGVYHSAHLENLKKIIVDESAYKLAGALHYGFMDVHYESLMADKEFLEKTKRANNLSSLLCLLRLWQIGLSAYYDLVIDSTDIAELIELLYKHGKGNLVPKLLNSQPRGVESALVKHLTFMCKNKMVHRCDDLLDSPELVTALEILPERAEYEQALIKLLKCESKVFTAEQLQQFCENSEIRKALNSICNDPHFNYVYFNDNLKLKLANICSSADVRIAIHNYINLNSVDTAPLVLSLIKSKEKCQAFNLIVNHYGIDTLKNEPELLSEITKSTSNIVHVVSLLIQRNWLNSISMAIEFDRNNELDKMQSLLETAHLSDELTENMFHDTNMLHALSELKYFPYKIKSLIKLFEKNLVFKNVVNQFQDSYLYAVLSELISKNKEEWISKDTFTEGVKSGRDLVLNIVCKYPEALNFDYFSNYRENFEFMQAAIRKNNKVIDYISESLRSNQSFMQEAMRFSYQTYKYADFTDVETLVEIKRELLHYQYVSDNSTRWHLFTARFKDKNLSEKYHNKTGDALKTEILEVFKQSLEGKSEAEIQATAKEFKENSAEYKLLCTSQGFTSAFFAIKTTSKKAVDSIIEDAVEYRELDHLALSRE